MEIPDMIHKLSGTYSEYEIFSDWVKAYALSISNTTDIRQGKIWEDRERQYMELVKKHGAATMLEFSTMNAMLVEELEKDMRDVLGEVYMSTGLGSKSTGQFFTPFHLSYLTARTSLESQLDHLQKNEQIKLNEPSCGSGGMIIAVAKVLKENGMNYQRKMKVVAQDLDWKAVYMAYAQLSMLGIDAVVIQGDTLEETFKKGYPKERCMYTPKAKGMLI